VRLSASIQCRASVSLLLRAQGGDCLCLALDIERPEAAIMDPARLVIKAIQPSRISADSFLDAVTYALGKESCGAEEVGACACPHDSLLYRASWRRKACLLALAVSWAGRGKCWLPGQLLSAGCWQIHVMAFK
jgi:hypothetical protein